MEQDRRARLAALRKKRGGKDPSEAKQGTGAVQANTQEDGETANIDLESVDDLELPAPILQLQDETVEALSRKIQEEILSQARAIANEGLENVEDNPKSSTVLTKDLKDDLKDYIKLARTKTDRALLEIFQERFEKEVSQS